MENNNEINLGYINKIFKYMKNGMSLETFAEKFNLTINEIHGIVELCHLYGKKISIINEDDTLVFKKGNTILDDLHKNKEFNNPEHLNVKYKIKLY